MLVPGSQVSVADTGPDDANHALEGIFISSLRLREPVAHKDLYSIFDIAPSILDYFDIAVPRDMIGESLITDGMWVRSQPRELADGLRQISVATGKRAYADESPLAFRGKPGQGPYTR